MRIIAGTAGRRNFRVPKVDVRPTTDRTREAMFSMLAHVIPGSKVLDLFTGSGALGLESLSRGAESCVFVDESRECVNTVKLNLATLRLKGGKVVQNDVIKMLSRVSLTQYDVIFADPPYWKNVGDRDFVREMFEIENLANILADDGMLVIEADERAEIDCGEVWEQIDRRKYGGCAIFFFQKKGAID
jgi:16S rRNA (guanine966-N2)-methyltransferase